MSAHLTLVPAKPTCDKLCCCHFPLCTAVREYILDVGPGRESYAFCRDHIAIAVSDMAATPMPFRVR